MSEVAEAIATKVIIDAVATKFYDLEHTVTRMSMRQEVDREALAANEAMLWKYKTQLEELRTWLADNDVTV